MGFGYNSPFHKGTPPGRRDSHRARSQRSMRRQRLLAAVAIVAVLVIVGAFALRGISVIN